VKALLPLLLVATPAWADAPPTTLGQSELYSDIAAKKIADSVRPFEPQYPLWSDGAEKHRWVWLPPGEKIVSGKPGPMPSPHKGNIDYWIFPVGTKLWKEFVFGSHRVETRLSIKVSSSEWLFATYAWNEAETEATLAPEAGLPHVYPIGGGLSHDIPGTKDCVTCHNRGGDMVLGFDALQLSPNRDPLAPHAQPAPEGGVSFKTLVDEGRLGYVPPALLQAPPVVKAKSETARAAMGYLHANCGGCHSATGTASHSWLFLRYPVLTASEDAAPAFSTAVGKAAIKIKIPGSAQTYLIDPGHPENSAIVYAMKRTGDFPMPPIGVQVPDTEAIALIERWIREM
jgi:hypothetical protein